MQKPFGIILFIGEGLDAQTLAAARLHSGGADKALALDSLPYTALLKNHSADSAVPDPAAAATAIATGTKVRNGSVALRCGGETLVALLELARENGRDDRPDHGRQSDRADRRQLLRARRAQATRRGIRCAN